MDSEKWINSFEIFFKNLLKTFRYYHAKIFLTSLICFICSDFCFVTRGHFTFLNSTLRFFFLLDENLQTTTQGTQFAMMKILILAPNVLCKILIINKFNVSLKVKVIFAMRFWRRKVKLPWRYPGKVHKTICPVSWTVNSEVPNLSFLCPKYWYCRVSDSSQSEMEKHSLTFVLWINRWEETETESFIPWNWEGLWELSKRSMLDSMCQDENQKLRDRVVC